MPCSECLTHAEPLALSWFAVRTRSNQERNVAAFLSGKGLEIYLPTYTVSRRWSDRIVISQKPYFPGYVFCRFSANRRLPVVTTPGVVNIVGFGSEPAAIPESQLHSVRQVLTAGKGAEVCPFLREGQSVRVTQGALEGVEGILLQKKANWKLVVSIELLQRSVAVEIDHDCITAL